MKILIFGSNGWIGKQFVNILEEKKISFFCANSRVDNIQQLTKELDNVQPTHVISFIGRTHGKIEDKCITTIDYLEYPGKLKENVRDNLYSIMALAILCSKKNIHYTYLGTGCIFSYDENFTEKNGIKENDEPNFYGSSYSTVKGYTDNLMRHFFNDSVLNLRIRMPLTCENNPRNFITKIVNYEKICSVNNSMSNLDELLPYIPDMMKKQIVGTFNFTNPGFINHNEILTLYKEIVDNNFTWNNFTLEEQNQVLKSKRSNNFLSTEKLQNLYPEIKHIKDSVIDCLKKYNKNI